MFSVCNIWYSDSNPLIYRVPNGLFTLQLHIWKENFVLFCSIKQIWIENVWYACSYSN